MSDNIAPPTWDDYAGIYEVVHEPLTPIRRDGP
jgi:hypothetical protein